MTKQWNDGPPPSIGWWPTRTRTIDDAYPFMYALRWHDGVAWSIHAYESDCAEVAAVSAATHTGVQPQRIQWSARPSTWPQRSRT